MPARDGGELGHRRLLGEADHAKVRLVHAQEQRGLCADCALVVVRTGAVRRPDLDEARAGPGEHVRDAEPVADLDQLATRDEHLTSFRERREREQHRPRVVVDHDRGFGAGQAAEDPADMILARAPCPGGEVVLEIRIGAARVLHALQRGLRKRGPPEVRVHDHPGRVQHPT